MKFDRRIQACFSPVWSESGNARFGKLGQLAQMPVSENKADLVKALRDCVPNQGSEPKSNYVQARISSHSTYFWQHVRSVRCNSPRPNSRGSFPPEREPPGKWMVARTVTNKATAIELTLARRLLKRTLGEKKGESILLLDVGLDRQPTSPPILNW